MVIYFERVKGTPKHRVLLTDGERTEQVGEIVRASGHRYLVSDVDNCEIAKTSTLYLAKAHFYKKYEKQIYERN